MFKPGKIAESNLDFESRLPCVLMLDTSQSMKDSGAIRELNKGIVTFIDSLKDEPVASRRVEVAIVTFGNGDVQLQQDFTCAADLQPPTLEAGGNTPLGKALNKSLDLVEDRLKKHKKDNRNYYRPWLVIMTDGEPTDSWESSAKRASRQEESKNLICFPIGVGDEIKVDTLNQISPRGGIKLKGYNFSDCFLWLSASLHTVSQSSQKYQHLVSLEPPANWDEDWSKKESQDQESDSKDWTSMN